MADLYKLRDVVTGVFYEHHVVVVRNILEQEDAAKQAAELLYQFRNVNVSTAVVFGWDQAIELKREVNRFQETYVPGQDYVTLSKYPLYSRGTTGAAPASRKRATYLGERQFTYAVVEVNGEHGTRFKINHFGGAAGG
jgi:hypothetical protein